MTLLPILFSAECRPYSALVALIQHAHFFSINASPFNGSLPLHSHHTASSTSRPQTPPRHDSLHTSRRARSTFNLLHCPPSTSALSRPPFQWYDPPPPQCHTCPPQHPRRGIRHPLLPSPSRLPRPIQRRLDIPTSSRGSIWWLSRPRCVLHLTVSVWTYT